MLSLKPEDEKSLHPEALKWLNARRAEIQFEVPLEELNDDDLNTFLSDDEKREFIRCKDEIAREWGLDLVIAKNEEALRERVGPKDGKFECCTRLKTEALRKCLEEHGFDALILAIRRDEHGIRAKERYFSPRDENFKWGYRDQPLEMWGVHYTLAKIS